MDDPIEFVVGIRVLYLVCGFAWVGVGVRLVSIKLQCVGFRHGLASNQMASEIFFKGGTNNDHFSPQGPGLIFIYACTTHPAGRLAQNFNARSAGRRSERASLILGAGQISLVQQICTKLNGTSPVRSLKELLYLAKGKYQKQNNNELFN